MHHPALAGATGFPRPSTAAHRELEERYKNLAALRGRALRTTELRSPLSDGASSANGGGDIWLPIFFNSLDG